MNLTTRTTIGLGRRMITRRAALTFTAGALAAVEAAGRGNAVELGAQGADVSAPGPYTMGDSPVSSVMQSFSTYVSKARDTALSEEVQEKTKWHILDSFAAIVSGSQLPGGQAATRFARAYGGRPVSTVVGDDALCGPIEAALANGTSGHADETDDFLRQWHPGISVVPAALALGEQHKVSGLHFLRAVAVGYDVGTRVKDATGIVFPDPRVATEGLGGVFGATGAAACVASLTPQQVRWALSYGAQQSSGVDSFRRDLDHIEKGFLNGGVGARSGVTAALLVSAGFTAVNDVFSGPAGFFETFGGTAKPELLLDKLGIRNEITVTNFKRWPTGSPIQPLLDGLEALFKRRTIDPGQITEITIRHIPDSITDNAGSTAINAQHAVALMLIDRTLNFRNIHDKARLKDPAVVRLRSLIKEDAPGRTHQGGPPTPVIYITLSDGTRIVQDEVGGIPGSASNPWTRDWVVTKARHLMTPVLGAARTNALIEETLNLERTKNILTLRPLLQRKYVVGAPPQLSDWPRGDH